MFGKHALSLAAASLILTAGSAYAEPDQVLFSFTSSGTHGIEPTATVLPLNGKLYGTTTFGGKDDAGTVYALTPPAAGKTGWTSSTVFRLGGAAGSAPVGSLVTDADGDLFGTASAGGADSAGTVFELTPPAAGKTSWRLTVLHSFTGNADGRMPGAGLTIGPDGVLYGTTQAGGPSDLGTIFRLTPPAKAGGIWTYSDLHDFTGADGADPACVLAVDANGALYGTAASGGSAFGGTVFKFVPSDDGGVITVLHSFQFDATDGGAPFAGVVIDGSGLLYGTTSEGGASGAGTVWILRPAGVNSVETILYDFTGHADGGFPQSALLLGADHTLYGTAATGLKLSNGGSLFKLLPPKAGGTAWRFRLMHHLTDQPDGKYAFSAPVRLNDAQLVTTTERGGVNDVGAVVSVKP